MKNILFFFLCCVGLSCRQEQQILVATKPITIDLLEGECPYLTKDQKGNIVLSWVRTLNDSTTAFCYAKSTDKTTFSNPVVIPNTGNIQPHGENMPKIIFKPSGEIIALWGTANPNKRNKYSGLIYYTRSTNDGKTWTGPRQLVQDTAGYDQRYYDVATLPNGETGIIWLDNRKTVNQEGSALYFAHTEGSTGFKKERLISQPTCQCCRTKLFVDSKGNVHALYRAILQDSIRDMVHIVSADGGKTFSAPERISADNWVLHACPHTGPSMTENKLGLHYAWYTGAEKAGSHYTHSTTEGKQYMQKDSITEKGTHPQINAIGKKDLLIVWDENEIIGDHVFKKIGIERRTADGRALGKLYLTEKSKTSFPVVLDVTDHSAIIAYTEEKEQSMFVRYQVVNLK